MAPCRGENCQPGDRMAVFGPKTRRRVAATQDDGESMNKTLELLLKKYSPLAQANGIDPKSVEFVGFMQQCAAAVNRQ